MAWRVVSSQAGDTCPPGGCLIDWVSAQGQRPLALTLARAHTHTRTQTPSPRLPATP